MSCLLDSQTKSTAHSPPQWPERSLSFPAPGVGAFLHCGGVGSRGLAWTKPVISGKLLLVSLGTSVFLTVEDDDDDDNNNGSLSGVLWELEKRRCTR